MSKRQRRSRRLRGLLPIASRSRRSEFAVELPNPYGGEPWLTAVLALSSLPKDQGKTLRLRAHVDGCMRLSPGDARPAIAERDDGAHSMFARGRRLIGTAVLEAVEHIPAERLALLTRRRWRSWVDVQFSTAPLDQGADALVPEPMRRIWGAGLPRAGAGKPRIGMWSGPAGGALGGMARLVWLQMDSRGLPSANPNHERDRGFNVNASMCRLVEPVQSGKQDTPASRN